MCSTRYLLLATIGVGLLALAASSPGQSPPAQNAPVVITGPNTAPPGVLPGFGGFVASPRDQRDIEADRQVQLLLKNLGEAKEEAAKTELQKKLSDALAKQFDVRQEVRERELKELEERVKRLRDVL